MQKQNQLESEPAIHLDDAARQRHTRERTVGRGRRHNRVNDCSELTRRDVIRRQVEVRVVEQVEEVHTDREAHSLLDLEGLCDVHVGVKVARTVEGAARDVSEIQLWSGIARRLQELVRGLAVDIGVAAPTRIDQATQKVTQRSTVAKWGYVTQIAADAGVDRAPRV